MSGTGKYTQYAAPMGDKYVVLKKLFGTHAPPSSLPHQMQIDPGKETNVRDAIIADAKLQFTPSHQSGDLGHFPKGVDMDFSGASLPAGPPKLEDVKWMLAGDPANPYAPDISSPGPGKTEGTDKSSDPNIKSSDLKPNYVPGAPGTGTKSPTTTSPKIVAANELGKSTKLGDSGGNV